MIPSRRRHVFGVLLSSNNRVQIRMLPCARSLAGAAFTGVSIPGYRETRRVRGPWARASTRPCPTVPGCVAYLAHRTLAPARWRLAPASPPCRFSAEAASMRPLEPICDWAFDSRPMRTRSRFASARPGTAVLLRHHAPGPPRCLRYFGRRCGAAPTPVPSVQFWPYLVPRSNTQLCKPKLYH